MERSIRVKGKGKISVKPDTIRLNIEAEGLFPEYGETVKKSAEETEKVRVTIEKAGLNPKELKTVHFGIDSEYESYRDERDNWKRRFMGYKYRHAMNIKFPNDNDILGKVLYQLSKCDVAVEFSINHTVKDTETVKNQLLSKAVEDSKAKAEVLAKAAEVMLGEIQSIDYSWGEIEIYSEPMDKMALGCADMVMEASASYDVNIEADDIDVQDTVTIVWSIQ